MQRQCDSCRTVFDFNTNDIINREKIRIVKEHESDEHKTLRDFWGPTEELRRRTTFKSKFLFKEKLVQCPVCNYENFLCIVEKKLIENLDPEVSDWGMCGFYA